MKKCWRCGDLYGSKVKDDVGLCQGCYDQRVRERYQEATPGAEYHVPNRVAISITEYEYEGLWEEE